MNYKAGGTENEKKTISITLAVMLVLCTAFSVTTFASAQGVYDNFKYVVLKDNTAEISQYTGSDQTVVIPSSVNGYSVSSIGDNSFRYCEGIKSITIPDSVNTIGYCAFDWCVNLTDITIPSNVKQ